MTAVDQIEANIANVMLYAALELLSFVVVSFTVWRRIRYSTLHQIAFVLETQWPLVQTKIIVWVLFTVQLPLYHFGAYIVVNATAVSLLLLHSFHALCAHALSHTLAVVMATSQAQTRRSTSSGSEQREDRRCLAERRPEARSRETVRRQQSNSKAWSLSITSSERRDERSAHQVLSLARTKAPSFAASDSKRFDMVCD